ncbi:hypothetical protein DB32_001949 [Sandaracinus amylolyticus]|uniref:Uncharacterized protein n=1 Tax=Sandaracinus amylolyticus TaxID=927083 RepID=A0A0F6W153_9BACT|nr:hypothetical protein DB32_001949 [Sandaracinus amylolyticus]
MPAAHAFCADLDAARDAVVAIGVDVARARPAVGRRSAVLVPRVGGRDGP